MVKDTKYSSLGIFGLTGLLVLLVLYLYNVKLAFEVTTSWLLMLIMLVMTLMLWMLFKVALMNVKIPKIVNIILIVLYVLVVVVSGAIGYMTQSEDGLNVLLDRKILKDRELEEEFIELFHALEIDNGINNVRSKESSLGKPTYLDYIIYKHKLWIKERLLLYKRQKAQYAADNKKWVRLLDRAQSYRKGNWQEKLKKIIESRHQEYVDWLKEESSRRYKILNILLNEEEQAQGLNKSEARQLYNLSYPGKRFPEESWEKDINSLIDAGKKDKSLLSDIIHNSVLEEFMRVYINTLL